MIAKLAKLCKQWSYVYSVKYLCGIFDPFPNVVHWTEINVHNPSPTKPAHLTKKFLVAGTQDDPKRRRHQETLVLPPNMAFALDCDEIYQKLGLPVTQATKGFVEIVSDRKLQVVGVYDKCTKQPHTDVFERSTAEVTVEFDTDLDGVFDFEADLRLVGRTVIKKSDQRLDASCTKFYIGTEIIDMRLEVEQVAAARLVGGGDRIDGEPGEGEPERTDIPVDRLPIDLGGLAIVQSPVFPTRGKICGPVDDRLQHQAGITSFFEVFSNVELPGALGELHGLLYNDRAVLMEADLTQVEPPEQPTDDGKNVYRTPRDPVPLISTATGQVVARIKAHHHTPNPPPPKVPKPKPKKHPIVPCENASIDVEYVQPVLKLARPHDH